MTAPVYASQWREIEIELFARTDWPNPYTNVEVWVDFRHSAGTEIRRPAFWDGGLSWKVRFASPLRDGSWQWKSAASVDDAGLNGSVGVLECSSSSHSGNGSTFYAHGFWTMSKGKRNLVHADGTPCMLAGDTAWALPWRATPEHCREYAADRMHKGYNAVLLMTVQPDMDARGPRDRSADTGFDVGFEDLPNGHLRKLNVDYFKRFDQLTSILIEHDLVPVYQPVFHGYGWKGLKSAGPVVPADEYARYCRYLVARYGARPAMWLVGADGECRLESIRAGGEEIQAWDAYGHPTGVHYQPHTRADAWQDAEWLDFQWCQTGHTGLHLPERVADMWRNTPVKAVANGEPTYENIGQPGRASGWWQGEEAWANVCAGGTMGAVYGAGSLWQWRLHADEPDFQDWAHAHGAGWREAIDFTGSRFAGAMRRVFDGFPFADMDPDWTSMIGQRGLSVPNQFLLIYFSEPGPCTIVADWVPKTGMLFDVRAGTKIGAVILDEKNSFVPQHAGPCAVIFTPRGTD